MQKVQMVFQKLVDPLALWQMIVLIALLALVVIAIVMLRRTKKEKKRMDELRDSHSSLAQSQPDVLIDTKPSNFVQKDHQATSAAPQGSADQSKLANSTPDRAKTATRAQKDSQSSAMSKSAGSYQPATTQSSSAVDARPSVASSSTSAAPVSVQAAETTGAKAEQREQDPASMLNDIIACWKKGQSQVLPKQDRIAALDKGLKLLAGLPEHADPSKVRNDWSFMFAGELRRLEGKP